MQQLVDETSRKAREMVAQGALLLDVRTPEEFVCGHIPGALNVPVDQVAARISDLGPKDRPVVIYCRSGVRSATAARILREAGFGTLLDLGAMTAW